MSLKPETIENLKSSIQKSILLDEDADDKSWSNQKGIIISRNEAEQIISALEDYHKIDVSELRHKIETMISELNAADVEFCKDRWDRPEIHPLQKAMAREESNKVTFARQELQEILKILPTSPIKTEVK